jgi:hypothetical protein
VEGQDGRIVQIEGPKVIVVGVVPVVSGRVIGCH